MTLIEKPVAGQPMRAGWGASVAERLNQIGSVGAPGQLVREGLFGQGVAPLPKNQRDRRGTPVSSIGCFEIEAGEPEVDEETGEEIPTIHFINRYYNYGNITIECDDVTLTPQADGLIVALRVPTDGSTIDPPALIVTYADLTEMQADQKNRGYCVIPLYSLSESFTILCDFRSMPHALVGENLMNQNQ